MRHRLGYTHCSSAVDHTNPKRRASSRLLARSPFGQVCRRCHPLFEPRHISFALFARSPVCQRNNGMQEMPLKSSARPQVFRPGRTPTRSARGEPAMPRRRSDPSLAQSWWQRTLSRTPKTPTSSTHAYEHWTYVCRLNNRNPIFRTELVTRNMFIACRLNNRTLSLPRALDVGSSRF